MIVQGRGKQSFLLLIISVILNFSHDDAAFVIKKKHGSNQDADLHPALKTTEEKGYMQRRSLKSTKTKSKKSKSAKSMKKYPTGASYSSEESGYYTSQSSDYQGQQYQGQQYQGQQYQGQQYQGQQSGNYAGSQSSNGGLSQWGWSSEDGRPDGRDSDSSDSNNGNNNNGNSNNGKDGRYSGNNGNFPLFVQEEENTLGGSSQANTRNTSAAFHVASWLIVLVVQSLALGL